MLRPLNDSMCIFGGDTCRFQDMMAFMEASRGYQFLFGSSIWFLPNRTTDNTIASASLLEAKLTVIGRKDAETEFSRTLNIIHRPFQGRTWAVVGVYIVVYFILHCANAVYWANPRLPINIFRNMLFASNPSPNPETENPEPEPILKVFAGRTLKRGAAISTLFLILFYEIAVASYVFLQNPVSLSEELRDLSADDLKKYLVTEGDATELLFRALVDPENKYRNGTPPWQFCFGKKDCYSKLLSDRAQFFFTYEQSRRFEQRKRRACSELAVFEPRSPLATVAAGIYYSSGFPRSRIVEIDRAILKLRVEHKIQDLINKENPPLDCGPDPASIPPLVVFSLLLPIIVLTTATIVIAGIAAAVLRRTRGAPASGANVERGREETGWAREQFELSSVESHSGSGF